MANRVANRDEVLEYVSEWLGVPVEKLTDDMLIGHTEGLLEFCCLKFCRGINVSNLENFTVGDLVRQLTSPRDW